MKRIPFFALGSLLTLAVLTSSPSAAQSGPAWISNAPAGTQYYYIPEVGGYYDVPARVYVLPQGGQWVRTSQLTGFDPAAIHPVLIDYHGNAPYTLVERHRTLYPAKLPPGQVRRLESGKPLPPGQAKKMYDNRGPGNGKGKGHGKH